MTQSGGGPGRDETVPGGGGIFRHLAPSSGSGFASAFGVLEGLFAPAAKAARDERERQKKVGARNPSDTDPPAEGAAPLRVAAPGRPGTPFSGSVVLRPAPRP